MESRSHARGGRHLLDAVRRLPLLAPVLFVAPLACTEPVAPAEPQAVVLEVEAAPEWAKPGAEIEVRDEQAHVLLKVALPEEPPVLVDFDAPPDVKTVAVVLRAEGREANGTADVSGGYAHCKVD